MSQLQTTLRQLRLSGLSQTLDVRLQEAAAGRLGHGEFLELILQDELKSGQRVQVTCMVPGVIELRSSDVRLVNGTGPARAAQPGCPF